MIKTHGINLTGRGLRGESQADILRRTGRYGVLPTDSDNEAMGKLNAAAEAAAATAEAASGPNYPDTASGLAATEDGEGFAVDNGDGTVTIWLNDGGVAVEQRTLATTDYLASPNGADAVGVDDGAGGALWTNVAGFVSRLMSSAGSSVVGFLQAGADAVTRSMQDKLRDTVNARDFGVVADGVTIDTTALQKAIDSFGISRGELHLPPGIIQLDANIDFKRVALVGAGVPFGGLIGGTTVRFTGTAGLYSSIKDNQAPHHRHFRLEGSAVQSANGQILLDWSGLNYPRATSILFYGGEVGMKLAPGPGNTPECHYGVFTGCDFSKCYHDVKIEGTIYTQSHTFVGGRSWDCVYSFTNDGAQDINLLGRQIEGGYFPNHTGMGATTKTVGCRFEGLDNGLLETVLPGKHISVGDYTSGFQFTRKLSVNGGTVTRSTGSHFIGANGADGYADALPVNMLFNPELHLNPSDNTKAPGWTIPNVAHTVIAGTNGPILKSTAAGSFHGYEQFGIDLPAGEYSMGFFIQKDSAEAAFSIMCQLLDSGGTIINDSAGGGTNFTSTPFTNADGSYRGNMVIKRIKLTSDRTNCRFRMAANGAAGKTVYIGKPFLFVGHGHDGCVNEGKFAFGLTSASTAADIVAALQAAGLAS